MTVTPDLGTPHEHQSSAFNDLIALRADMQVDLSAGSFQIGAVKIICGMRPSILTPLFADITSLAGIGPKNAVPIQKVAGGRLVDLLHFPPISLIDRSLRPLISEAPDGSLATLSVTVDKHTPPPDGKNRLPYKIICSDMTGYVVLIFFHARPDFLLRELPVGEKRLVSGKTERYQGELQMVHPDYIIPIDEAEKLPLFEPVYPLTAGLHAKTLGRAIQHTVACCPELPEWHRTDILQKDQWPPWHDAIHALHSPASRLDLSPASKARERLAYDELLANQLALSIIRMSHSKTPGRAFAPVPEGWRKLEGLLGFALTAAQRTVMTEIAADMAADQRMVRLLQGDVGSGKTIVALFAMLQAVLNGAQAAIMAPTEILARQHFDEIAPLCEALSLTAECLTGTDKGPMRAAKLNGLKKGYIDIIIGTHTLFSDDIDFHDLGLAIVDEQHRFGVQQRLAVQRKGVKADLLVMTATPIPRTLALTSYGDMDISLITDKPAGRKPVDTRVIPLDRIEKVIAAIGRAIMRAEQIYWVCPLIEDSDQLDLTAATDRFNDLDRHFKGKVALIHGQMTQAAKDAAIEAFLRGDVNILVATTVIEVGVNAPNATIMVVEHAERFGLAQLHQLRGRVGRGQRASTCLLLYKANANGQLSDTAKARLSILRQSNDGFLIAEEDLRLRGAGDALGTAQSGFPQFLLASIPGHGKLLLRARQDAELILREDAKLTTPRGEALRCLLYLFGREDAVRLMRAG